MTPYPLGRRLEPNHDPRSKDFPAEMVSADVPLKTLLHRRYGGVFDQGQLGSCTGNAAAGAINTVPVHKTGARVLKEADAVALYSLATELDPYTGTYPPDDTGSDGLSVAKAAKRKGYISGYSHAFGVDQAVRALQLRPVITGVPWYDQMFYPTEQGFVHIGGGIAGGHEFEVAGYVASRRPYVVCFNSWGSGWGLNGRFKLFVDEWAQLLVNGGDVTVLTR